MTIKWWAKALAGRPDGEGLTRYAWMDHNGWHTAEELPAEPEIIPTGHVWAWGANVWAYWREEHQRSEVVGIVVRQDSEKPSGEEWEEAKVEDIPPISTQKEGGHEASQAKVQPPALHSDTRFFETIGEKDPFNDYGKPVQLVRVMSPARIDLFSRSDA